MTELVVILSLSLAGTGAAGYLLRWLLGMPVGDREMNRLANLVRETAETFSRRQSSTIAALGALFGGALFLGYGLQTSQSDPVPGLELGIWFVVSFALGLGVTLITGQIATFLMTRGAIRTASGARKSIDVTLQVALRTGTTVALFSGSLSTLTVACLCLGVLAHHGFFGSQPGEALYVVPLIPTLLLGFALGAIFAALLSQLSGGIFSKAADIGADLGAREVGLDDDDVENPAAIANLAGDCAGKGASGAMLGVAVASVEDFGAMLAMAIVYRADASLRDPFALVLLPLMSRGFSLLASAFGAFVVRTDNREEP